jgi:NitT/TauT family transport system substrate-binding protein
VDRPATVSRRSALAAVGGALAFPYVARAQGLTTITLGGLPEDSATPALYAIQSGLFRKYGLDVTIQPQRSGPAVASGVAGGAYQIGKASIPPLAIAHAKNVPFVIVAPAGLSTEQSPIAGLMVKADSPIKTAAELNGKILAVGALTDVFTLALKTWMDKNGGDSSSLKFVEITISAIPEAIETGRVVAGSANEPILGAALASGKVRVLAHTFDAISPHFMYTAWFTTQSWANAHRDAVDKFARAMKEAAEYTNAHHAETVDLISKFTGIPATMVRTMTRTQAGTTLDPGLIQPVIDASAKYKDIPAPFAARDIILAGLA